MAEIEPGGMRGVMRCVDDVSGWELKNFEIGILSLKRKENLLGTGKIYFTSVHVGQSDDVESGPMLIGSADAW